MSRCDVITLVCNSSHQTDIASVCFIVGRREQFIVIVNYIFIEGFSRFSLPVFVTKKKKKMTCSMLFVLRVCVPDVALYNM